MSKTEREEFIKQFVVSRETWEKLDRYAELLAQWNERFNLVAESTLPHIWSRHFMDSAQLFQYLPNKDACIADMGAGAGFPGLVLSIMGAKHVHLIEATGKKANFLREVIEQLKLTAIVHQQRVENMKDMKADIVIARALSALPELLKLAMPLLRKGGICIFPKGQKANAELTESQKTWKFIHDKHQSLSDPSGSVLIIKNLERKNGYIRNFKPKSKRK